MVRPSAENAGAYSRSSRAVSRFGVPAGSGRIHSLPSAL
jgi:hypothetical protein